MRDVQDEAGLQNRNDAGRRTNPGRMQNDAGRLRELGRMQDGAMDFGLLEYVSILKYGCLGLRIQSEYWSTRQVGRKEGVG